MPILLVVSMRGRKLVALVIFFVIAYCLGTAKIKLCRLSTAEGEYIAAAVHNSFGSNKHSKTLDLKLSKYTFSNNTSSINLSNDPIQYLRTNIGIQRHFLKDPVQKMMLVLNL